MSLKMYDNIILNRTLSKLVGFETSAYWSILMEIIPKVISKKAYDGDGYFIVSRSYIENQIGLDIVRQYNCDSALLNLGVLEYDQEDRNRIRVSIQTMEDIINAEGDKDQSWIKAAATVSTEIKKLNREAALKYNKEQKAIQKEQIKLEKETVKENKTACIVANFQKIVEHYETDEELLKLYKAWISSVYARNYFLTKEKIEIFVNQVNSFTTDKNTKIELVRIAVNSGGTLFDWALNTYKSLHPNAVKSNTTTMVQNIAQEKPTDVISF